jgi:hypothetical protein
MIQQSDIITREISEETRIWAREMHDRIEAIFASSWSRSGNYTGLDAPDRWYKGYVGEREFCNYLDERGKRYVYRPHADGYADDGSDLIVYNAKYGNEAPINVKAGYSEWHRVDLDLFRMMIPEPQYQKFRGKIVAYVAARIYDNYRLIDFAGCILARDVARYEPSMVRCATRAVPYRDLYKLDFMLKLLE